MRVTEFLRRIRSVRLKVSWVLAVIALIALGVGPYAYVEGRATGQRTQEHAERGRSELEHKILAWIVERNPQATIREFSEFPRFVLDTSRENDMDFRVVLAVIDKESGFKPDAVGKSGEVGLMQILPPTAELVAKKLGMKFVPPTRDAKTGAYTALGSLGDPRVNVRLGTTYLRWQIDRYGLNPTALRAYNRNPDNAREHRPADRYAEEVSFRFLALALALK
jgi:soluble lytic murein transglycosylase